MRVKQVNTIAERGRGEVMPKLVRHLFLDSRSAISPTPSFRIAPNVKRYDVNPPFTAGRPHPSVGMRAGRMERILRGIRAPAGRLW